MKTTPRIITALAIAGAFVTTAVQAAESGPYIRLDNGVNSISGADLRLQSNTVQLLKAFGYDAKDSQKLKFKESYIFGGAVGYRFGESFSTEIELDHAENKVDTIGVYSVKQSAVGGFLDQSSITFKQTNLLVSGIYSPKLSETVTLNLGAGFGAQFSSANLEEGSLTVAPGLRLSGKQKSDAAFWRSLKPACQLHSRKTSLLTPATNCVL